MQMLTTVSEEDTGDTANQHEVDRRFVLVGHVYYRFRPEEVQEFVQSCGQINRSIVLADKYGTLKGLAYVEFHVEQTAQNSLFFNGSLFGGRPLKVNHQRANIFGFGKGKGNPSITHGFLGGQGGQQDAVAEVHAQLMEPRRVNGQVCIRHCEERLSGLRASLRELLERHTDKFVVHYDGHTGSMPHLFILDARSD